ncbi:TGRM2 protein, partial [Urocolius indicus]|nr:TGRM2 protein [Urocolius indicus]
TQDESEKLHELCKLLTDKVYQTRMEGVALLQDYCNTSPSFVSTNILRIFDVFVPRLQDCHKKIIQKALEILALMVPVLKDALQSVLFPVIVAVINNLNSKHLGIYDA